MMINMKPLGPGEVEEKISIFVEIESVGDDIAHPDGFQVDFYGISQTDAYVNCVNMFGPDEKDLADELISTILPGTCWYVTGDPTLLEHRGVTVIHDCTYQPYDPSKIDGQKAVKIPIKKFRNKSASENFPWHQYSYLNPYKSIFAGKIEYHSKSEMTRLIETTKSDIQRYLWQIFSYHKVRAECMAGWLNMLNIISGRYYCNNIQENGDFHYSKKQLEGIFSESLFGDIDEVQKLIDMYAKSEFPIIYVSNDGHKKLMRLSKKFVDSIIEGTFFKAFTVVEEELL